VTKIKKIWCQSSTSIGTANLYKDYDQSLQKHAKKVCGPDTVCEFHGQDKTIPGVDRSYVAWHIAETTLIRNAIRAQRDGFDAFVEINTIDTGLHELPEVVDIPVIFISQATLYFALMMGSDLAFLTHNEIYYHQMVALSERYHLSQQIIAGGHLDISYQDLGIMWQKPKIYIESFLKEATKIANRGPGYLFPAPTPLSQWLIDQGIKEVDGAMILDPLGMALKIAEIQIDLYRQGFKRSQRGTFALPSESIRNALRSEFSM
jgi:allantoin racemase